MKTLKQFLIESELTDQEHFEKHAKAYIHHANLAAKQEENPDDYSEDAADASWERSRHHVNEIQKRFGSAGRDYVTQRVHSVKDDFSDHWHEFSKK